MGMPEYHDGSYGPIKPIDESLKDLLDQKEQMRTRALHVGKFEELLQRAEKVPDSGESESIAKILQGEFEKLRLDVNRIMIHLGIDDKTKVLPVGVMPHES